MSASQDIKNNEIIEVVALALRFSGDGRYLLARRGPGESGSGYWEFPGGKIENGETQHQALRREIKEELSFDLSPFALKFVGENTHQYLKIKVKIYLWQAEVSVIPEFQLVDHDQTQWYRVDEIKKINLSEADKYFISLIK